MSATFYPLPNTPPAHSHHPPSEIELRNIPSDPSISSSIHDSESTDEYGTHFQDPVHTTSGPDPSPSQAEVCSGGITSRPEDNDEIESLTEPRAQYHVFRYWKWELVSMAVAIGLLLAIIVLISQYHDRSINEWTFPINLTTLLALLATIFRTIILIPITSVISQSKWDWVGRDQVRLLSDIQDIDMASRGPWGAISIIPLAAKGNIPALVAAITSILTLATAPFVQQAVITVECERTTQGAAAVPYAHFVPRSGGYSNPAGSPVPGEGSVTSAYDTELMVQSCQAGPDAPDNQIRPSCATGNCTFSDGDPTEDGGVSHSTIAMCHQCQETSSLLKMEEHTIIGGTQMAATSPNGGYIGPLYNTVVNSIVDSNLTWAKSIMGTPDVRRLSNAALLNVTTLAKSNPGEYLSVTCILYTCLRSYRTWIQDGQLHEEELASAPASPDLLSDPYPNSPRSMMKHLVAVKSPCRAGGVVYAAQNMSAAPNPTQLSFCETPDDGGACQTRNVSAPEACIYRQHGRFAHAMRRTLATAFSGTCGNPRGAISCKGAQKNGGPFSSTTKWLLDLQFGANNSTINSPYGDSRSSFLRIDERFGAFAAAVSQRYRASFGAQSYGLNRDHDPADGLPAGEVRGRAAQTLSCTSAQLAWMAFPAALAALTASLLAWAVARSWARRGAQPVWKETLLPLVLYRDRLLLDGGTMEQLDLNKRGVAGQQPVMELSQMAASARHVSVRFRWNEPSSAENGLKKRTRVSFDVDSLLEETG